ncbi:MAG: hypothetical protein ACR2NM_00835, partial [Bythopirellula sp.]
LANETPSHGVCYWMGNTEKVALESYLQVHDQHYARAAGLVPPGSKVLHNPTHALPGITSHVLHTI